MSDDEPRSARDVLHDLYQEDEWVDHLPPMFGPFSEREDPRHAADASGRETDEDAEVVCVQAFPDPAQPLDLGCEV